MIEYHNENAKLKKQLKKSKEKIDALIQQNIKLNQEMRQMEDLHKLEIQKLQMELNKNRNGDNYDNDNIVNDNNHNDDLTTEY